MLKIKLTLLINKSRNTELSHFLVCLHYKIKGFHCCLPHEPMSPQEHPETLKIKHVPTQLLAFLEISILTLREVCEKEFSFSTFILTVFLYVWICTSPENDLRLANVLRLY